MPAGDQAPLVAWLRAGGPWNGKAPEIVETHAALVFLIDDHAFKLKKAVDLGYLDFSTVDKRRAVLQRELVVNRRTAPGLYLRTFPVTRTDGGFALDGKGEPVDWLLEMRRFPAEALLSRIADREELDGRLVEKVAAAAARFHNMAEPVPGFDWPAAVARIAHENTADLHAQSATLGWDEVETVILARERARAANALSLAAQTVDVRRCHGDLHLGNVFLDVDRPVLFDAIEFDDFYATMPPAYDIAFLIMDLLDRDLPRLANRAFNSWVIHRDPAAWPDVVAALAAVPLYLGLRAEIRAKTEGRRPHGTTSAKSYLALARKVLAERAPRLVAIGGLSGTGKSSLARELACRFGQAPGALHLRTDEIRKRLAGVPLEESLPAAAYTAESSAAVYAKLNELARAALGAGHAVIVDGVFAAEHERRAVGAMARERGIRFDGLWLDAPRSVLEHRLRGRVDDASDADVAVLRQQLTYDLGHVTWHHIDVSGPLATTAEAVHKHLDLEAPN